MKSAEQFVHAFHADLSDWFSGTGERHRVWARLQRGTPEDMVLVYPSGRRLRGSELLESIQDLYGRSPGFVASISDFEIVRGDESHAVVSYVESQTGARQSAAENRRSALAVIERDGGDWKWRFVQETALDAEYPA